MLVLILVAVLAFAYWQYAKVKKEHHNNSLYRLVMGEILHEKKELLNPETAYLSDLLSYKKDRQRLTSIPINDEERKKIEKELKEWGLTWQDLDISEAKMREVEVNCHRNEAKFLYKLMKGGGFELKTYNRLREEAKLAGFNPSEIFTPGQVSIFVVRRNGRLLYRDGWRQATASEIEKFKAIEVEKEAQRQKYEAEAKTERGDSIRINGHYLVNYNPTGANINASFTTEEDGTVFCNWAHTENGYEVPNFVDITDIFTKDGLKVIDDSFINSHISPI